MTDNQRGSRGSRFHAQGSPGSNLDPLDPLSPFATRHIRDVLAADVESKSPTWLLDAPMIPRRGISIVCGYRGSSKTTWAAWLAAEVTRQGHEVLFASQEDTADEFIKPRLEAAGADLARIRFPREDDPHLRFPADVVRLAHYIEGRKTALVVLDPLEAFVPGFANPQTARDALTPLAYLSRHYHCAIVFVHHFRKSGGKTAVEAMGGAGALSNVARAIYIYGGKPIPDGLSLLLGAGQMFKPTEAEEGVEQKNVRMLAPLKMSAAELPPALLFDFATVDIGLAEPVPKLSYLGDTEVDGETLFAGWRYFAKRDEEAESVLDEALNFVLEFLQDGPQTVNALHAAADELRITAITLKRARAKIKVIAYRDKEQWWVKLPPTPDTLPEGW